MKLQGEFLCFVLCLGIKYMFMLFVCLISIGLCYDGKYLLVSFEKRTYL